MQYISPEQVSGLTASPATDMYSLGIVVYEALAGRRPFTGESKVAIALAQVNEAPPDLPAHVPGPVRDLVLACLAKKPADRPAPAANLARSAHELRRFEPVPVGVVVLLVMGIAYLAGTLPARHASRQNPIDALRYE